MFQCLVNIKKLIFFSKYLYVNNLSCLSIKLLKLSVEILVLISQHTKTTKVLGPFRIFSPFVASQPGIKICCIYFAEYVYRFEDVLFSLLWSKRQYAKVRKKASSYSLLFLLPFFSSTLSCNSLEDSWFWLVFACKRIFQSCLRFSSEINSGLWLGHSSTVKSVSLNRLCCLSSLLWVILLAAEPSSHHTNVFTSRCFH